MWMLIIDDAQFVPNLLIPVNNTSDRSIARMLGAHECVSCVYWQTPIAKRALDDRHSMEQLRCIVQAFPCQIPRKMEFSDCFLSVPESEHDPHEKVSGIRPVVVFSQLSCFNRES